MTLSRAYDGYPRKRRAGMSSVATVELRSIGQAIGRAQRRTLRRAVTA